jgi:uncharacterized Zn finger protein (UPF0148 family)
VSKVGRPRTEAQQEPPTAEERRSGEFFECPECWSPDNVWALRFKHPREILCLSCGRRVVRERKQAQRARARGEDTPTPRTPRQTKTEPIAGKQVEVEDFVREPQTAMVSEVDRIVQQATRKRRPKKPGAGLVRR